MSKTPPNATPIQLGKAGPAVEVVAEKDKKALEEERMKAAAKFRARMVADIKSSEPDHVEGRFKDWTKGEMVLQLVQRGVVIRNEHQISYKIVRDLMKSYYDVNLDDPPKPVSRYNSLTQNVVDRGILLFQDLFFRYLYKVRLYGGIESYEIDMKRNNERDFGDAYGGNTNLSQADKQRRKSLGTHAIEMEATAAAKMSEREKKALNFGKKALSAFTDVLGVKYRGVRSTADAAVLEGADTFKEDKHDFHSTLVEIANEVVAKGRVSRELKRSEHGERVFGYLDAPFSPPSWDAALEHAESRRPRRWIRLPDKQHDEYESFDFHKTSTGRHCMSGGMGEQCDIFHEGKYSELAPLGPSVTNFFKFVKWLIWVFALLVAVSLIMTIINVYGPRSSMNTYDMRLSDITMTTIGNLVYGLTGRDPGSFMVIVPGCYEGAFTAVKCQMDKNALGWVYAATDWAVVVIFIIALVWLKKYERKEEVALDQRLITVAMYSVMIKNLPVNTTEDDVKRYIEEVCEVKGLGDPAVEAVTLGLDKFKSDEEDEDEEGLKKLYKLEHDVEQAVSSKQSHSKTAAGAASDGDGVDMAEKGASANPSGTAAKPGGGSKGVYASIFGPKKYSLKDVIKRGKLVEERKRLVQKHRFDVTRLRTGNYPRGTGPRAVSPADIEDKVNSLREIFFQDVLAINEEIADMDGCLSLLQKKADHARVAFVTFETVEMAEKVKEAFEAGYLETIGGWVGIKVKNEREDDIYPLWRGKRLRIVPAPDPEDVIWENLNVEWWPRMRGRIITVAIGLLLCIISLVLLVTAKDQLEKAYSQDNAGMTAGAETLAFFLACIIALNNYLYEQSVQWFATHFEKHHSRETMEQSVFTRLLFFRLINCTLIFLVCNNQFFQLMEPPHEPADAPTDDDNLPLALYIVRNAHNPSVVDFDYSWYSSVGLMLMLVQIISVITSQISLYQQWRKYQSQLESTKSHCRVHQHILSAAVDLKSSEDDTVAGGGSSVHTSDVEMGTVSSRGSSFSIFGGKQTTLDGLYHSIQLSRSVEKEDTRLLLTQKEVNDKVEGPVFDWPVVYAQMISTIFVTLTFGTGIPMLYAFALIKFIVAYFGYKYLFLNLYKLPPRNRSSKLSREATALIPLALTIHILMSIWMLSYTDIFNNDAASARDGDPKAYLSPDDMVDRIMQGHTLASIGVGALLLVACLLGFLYGRRLLDKDNIYAYLFTIPCTGVCGSGSITNPTVPGSLALETNFARAVMRNLIRGPNNYSILSNPQYTDKLGVGYDFAARHSHIHAKAYSDMNRSGKALPPRDKLSRHKDNLPGNYGVKRSAPYDILHYELGQRLRSMAARKFRPIKLGDDPSKNDIGEQELLEVVNLVYEIYNPSKLPEVPELVGKFTGREHTMCASLVRKYHIGMDAFETQIYAIYETFNPDKTPDVEGIVAKYKGIEKKLFEGLRVKYRINMHPVENEMWTIIDEYDPKRRDEIVHMLNDAGGPHTERSATLLQQIRDMYHKGLPMPLQVKANAEHFKYEYYNPFPRTYENIPLVPHSVNYKTQGYAGTGTSKAASAILTSPRERAAFASSGSGGGAPNPTIKTEINGYTPVSLVTVEAQEGKYILENGHLYVGRLKGRVPEGQGRMNDPHSSLELEGTFVKGKLRGKGRLLTVGGNLYEGEFNDLFDGYGVYKWKDGSVYEGYFKMGKKEGVGRYTGPSGNTYEGAFVNDEFDGFGIYTNASNGVVYEGYFLQGRKHGAGQLFSKDGRSRNGVWSEGKEQKGAAPTEEQVKNVKTASDAAHKTAGRDPHDPSLFVPSVSSSSSSPSSKMSPRSTKKDTAAAAATAGSGGGSGGSFKATAAEDNAKDAESWSETVTATAPPLPYSEEGAGKEKRKEKRKK